jgi:hypothetical protein
MKNQVHLFIILLSAFFISCNHKKSDEQVSHRDRISYYLYDYRNGEWLLTRNALIIKNIQINDSISKLEITNNHNFVEESSYHKELYKKRQNNAILFSEDSLNYYICYNFSSKEERYLPFNPFLCFDYNEEYKVEQYSTYFYLSNQVFSFVERRRGVLSAFLESLDFPLVCKTHGLGEFYILSDIIGEDEKRDFYLSYTQRLIRSRIYAGFAFEELPAMYPFYLKRRELIENLEKKGFNEQEVIDSINKYRNYELQLYDSIYFVRKNK